MNQEASQASATRGLATVALLKTNFDAGRDHIGMFQPFVLDAAAALAGDGFTLRDLADSVTERHGLRIPDNTLRTLLGRSTKAGYLRREAGMYFKADRLSDEVDLVHQRAAVEARQRNLARSLCEFAETQRHPFDSEADALAAVLDFLDAYHVRLALADTSASELDDGFSMEEESLDRKRVVVASFIHNEVSTHGSSFEILQEMVEGYILQNALLLKDISAAERRFRHLTVYLDTGVLLGALGFRGEAMGLATREALSLLRETGAGLSVFRTTIRELKSILSIYEQRLATSEGVQSLRPTDVTRFLLTSRFRPSDVRAASSLVEKNLLGLGVNIRDVPEHRVEYTLDEADLGRRLSNHEGGEGHPRVVHDIDCVAGVLTLRAGTMVDSIDDARAIFSSTSGITVKTVTEWYETQEERGVPPIIHHLTLSNLAWLKKPASAAALKLHELVALCAAALHPPRRTWEAFLKHLKKLKESGELSSDEVTAIIASELADVSLLEIVDDDEPDAATFAEVVERVRTGFREQADSEIQEALERAEASEGAALQLRMNAERRARSVAKISVWTVVVIIGAGLFAGAVLSLPGWQDSEPPRPLEWGLSGVQALGGLMSVLWGFNLRGWRLALEERAARRLRVWMTGEE